MAFPKQHGLVGDPQPDLFGPAHAARYKPDLDKVRRRLNAMPSRINPSPATAEAPGCSPSSATPASSATIGDR